MGDDNIIVAFAVAVVGFLCVIVWIAWRTSPLIALGAAPILWVLGLGFVFLMLFALILLGESKDEKKPTSST